MGDNDHGSKSETETDAGKAKYFVTPKEIGSAGKTTSSKGTFSPGFLNQSLNLHGDVAYKMDHTRRGVAVVFDIHHFKHLRYRSGSKRDSSMLKTTLSELGFYVKVLSNANSAEIKNVLLTEAAKDHSDADCFLCIFLSHGDDGIVYGSDGDYDEKDTQIPLQELFDLFRGDRCPSLVGKPKIFIVQACRGSKFEEGVSLVEVDAASTQNIYEVEEGTKPTIPSGADFLISYSTSEGYFSHRDTCLGSWFIQDLVKVMKEYGSSTEFTTLLTYVNSLVAKRAVERCLQKELVGKKQMPCFLSMLTKQLIFTPKRSNIK